MFQNWQIRALLGLRQIDVSQATGINMTRISLEERGLITYNATERAAIRCYFERCLQPYGYPVCMHSESSLEVVHA